MKFSIMENATDSLQRAINCYSENTHSGLKAATKELISCIELFTKEKLRRLDLNPNDAVLLFTNLKITLDDKRTKYVVSPISKKQTVTFDEAVDRLEWLGSPITKSDQSIVGRLKKIRNCIEHLEIDEDSNALKKYFADSLSFTILFQCCPN
jgi:hypothetical protein